MDEAELGAEVRERLVAEDAAGAAELVIRVLGPAILRFTRAVAREEALAADGFSEFAEDLWRGLPSFRGDASVKTWAYRIAWRAVMRVCADAWQRRRVPLSGSPASRLAEDVRSRTPVVLERQARALETLRARLTVEEQALLTLRVDQGLSWAEVAAVLSGEGEPVQADALAKRYQRLKERLAELAHREGLVE